MGRQLIVFFIQYFFVNFRRVWHTSRHASDKTTLNRASRELKELITEANDVALETYFEGLSATKATNYSLWKACKNVNRPLQHKPPLRTEDGWIRTEKEKVEAFAVHLSNVFKPNDAKPNTDESDIDATLDQDFQLHLPLNVVTPGKVRGYIKLMDNNKAPGPYR